MRNNILYIKIISLVLVGIVLPSAGYCTQYFNVNVYNQSLMPIFVSYDSYIGWNHMGAIEKYPNHSPRMITPGDFFNFKPDDQIGLDADILVFYVGVPQANKNYTSEMPFILSNEKRWVGIYGLSRIGSTEEQFTTGFQYHGEHQINIRATMSSKLSMVTTNNVGGDDRRVNAERWYSNAVGTATTTAVNTHSAHSTRRVYSDIHGVLESGTLYNYYKSLPPSSFITFNESTQDVLLITRGHLYAEVITGARITAQYYPDHPGVNCDMSPQQLNIKDSTLIQATKPLSTRVKANQALESTKLGSRGATDAPPSLVYPSTQEPLSLNGVIIQDFKEHVMSNLEKYSLWVGDIQNPYSYDFLSHNTLVPHKTDSGDVYAPLTLDDFDLNPDNVDYQLTTKGTDTVLQNPGLKNEQVVEADPVECKFNSIVNTNCNTDSYSKTKSNTVTHTLTNGWKIANTIKIGVPPLSDDIAIEYNGSVADGTADSTSVTVTVPSQSIPVIPGCRVVTRLEILSGTLDTDYTMYTKMDNNMPFQLRKPWKYMPQPKSNKEAGDVIGGMPPISGTMVKPWGRSGMEKLRSLSSPTGIVK